MLRKLLTGLREYVYGVDYGAEIDFGGRHEVLEFCEDFLGKAGDTLPALWKLTDVSPAGAPTKDYVTSAKNGQYLLQLAANNEAEQLALTWGDSLQLVIQDTVGEKGTGKKEVSFRFKVDSDPTGAGGSPGASGIIVLGLCDTYNANLDAITYSCWVKLAGANHNVTIESDDNVTDNNNKATNVTWAEGAFYTITFDFTDLANVKVWWEVDSTGVRTLLNNAVAASVALTVLKMTSVPANTGLQVIVASQKGAVANLDNKVTTDFVRGAWQRLNLVEY